MTRSRALAPVLASLLVHVFIVRGAGEVVPLAPAGQPLPKVDEVLMNVGFADPVEPEATLAEAIVEEAPPVPEPPPPPVAPEPPSPPVAPDPPSEPAPVADAAGPAAAVEPAAPAPEPVVRDAPEKKARSHVRADRAPRVARTTRRSKGTPAPTPEPCPEANPGIASVGKDYWSIDRDLIDFYATHIPELMKQGTVYTHRNEAGDLEGFRVGLTRCSIVRQGGLRSGDVVKDINGVRINTIFQAVGAYFKLRDEPTLQVRVERRGKPMLFSYDIEQKKRKRDVGQPGDYAAEALLRMHAEGTEGEGVGVTAGR